MLVFIDESGCPGFKLDRDSDPVFVIAMVVFATGDAARATEQVITDLREVTAHRTEFKFCSCRPETRDTFFRAIRVCPFFVRAVVVEKQMYVAPRTSGREFCRFFTRELLRLGARELQSARVRIDGVGHRESTRELRRYLRSELKGNVRRVQMVDSARDPLIQLADMCVGAIARAYRERQDASRWLEMLWPRIKEIREFK
jgi:hypothetical protein